MKRLHVLLGAALLAPFAWTGAAEAQSTITAAEVEALGFAVPPENVMIVVISHTGSYDRPVSCLILRDDEGKKMELGDLEAGESKPYGVDAVDGLVGRVFVKCAEHAESRIYTSDIFQSVGRTVVNFSTGSKMVTTRRIVP
jgi:hypothetical protein